MKRFHICKDVDTCLGQIRTTSRVAIAASRHHSDNSPAISDSEMFCFTREENIYTYSVSMLAKKQHHFLGKINSMLRTISESGLLLRWAQQSESQEVNSGDDAPAGGHGDGAVVKLKMEHVEGGFLLHVLGLIIATIAFIGEHVVFRFQNNQTFREKVLKIRNRMGLKLHYRFDNRKSTEVEN